jgi:hypothetical protein
VKILGGISANDFESSASTVQSFEESVLEVVRNVSAQATVSIISVVNINNGVNRKLSQNLLNVEVNAIKINYQVIFSIDVGAELSESAAAVSNAITDSVNSGYFQELLTTSNVSVVVQSIEIGSYVLLTKAPTEYPSQQLNSSPAAESVSSCPSRQPSMPTLFPLACSPSTIAPTSSSTSIPSFHLVSSSSPSDGTSIRPTVGTSMPTIPSTGAPQNIVLVTTSAPSKSPIHSTHSPSSSQTDLQFSVFQVSL